MDYTFYNPDTGRITTSVKAQPETLPLYMADHAGDAYIEGSYSPNEWYYAEGSMVQRQRLDDLVSWDKTAFAADAKDNATLSGLPNPSVVQVQIDDGAMTDPATVTDGAVSLVADTPATYRVLVDAWPFKPFVSEVVAS